MVKEGIDNLNVAKELIDKYKLSCPIIETTYSIIFEKLDPSKLLNSIML